MRPELILAGLVGLLIFFSGYVLGWRNGHLLGVRYALKMYLNGIESIPESLLKQYTIETMEEVKTIEAELEADAIYQAQLKAQENG